MNMCSEHLSEQMCTLPLSFRRSKVELRLSCLESFGSSIFDVFVIVDFVGESTVLVRACARAVVAVGLETRVRRACVQPCLEAFGRLMCDDLPRVC